MIISKRALYALLVSVLFALLAGFRVFGMDRDYSGYQLLFESIAAGYTAGDIGSRLEPAFIFINKLFASFFPNDFPLFMGMCAFFGLFWKLRLLTLQRYYLLPFLIYFLILFPMHEMTQVRVAMALGFGYWGIHLSIEGKKLSGFLWLVLGALSRLVRQRISERNRVLIDSVLPSALNRVACPTKLVEYMAHGLFPIVSSPQIGDFFDQGYEYIPADSMMNESGWFY